MRQFFPLHRISIGMYKEVPEVHPILRNSPILPKKIIITYVLTFSIKEGITSKINMLYNIFSYGKNADYNQ